MVPGFALSLIEREKTLQALLDFVLWWWSFRGNPWAPTVPRSSVDDHLSSACIKLDHPQLDQFFQMLLKGSAFTGGMPYKLVIGAVPRITAYVDWLRISGWLNPS